MLKSLGIFLLANMISASEYMLGGDKYEFELGDQNSKRFKDVILYPKDENHRYTIIWLHGIAQNGGTASQMFTEKLELPPGVKVILPTAPAIPITMDD